MGIEPMALPAGMVCRAWVTINGTKRYARDYKRKAFCFFPKGKRQKTTFDNVHQGGFQL